MVFLKKSTSLISFYNFFFFGKSIVFVLKFCMKFFFSFLNFEKICFYTWISSLNFFFFKWQNSYVKMNYFKVFGTKNELHTKFRDENNSLTFIIYLFFWSERVREHSKDEVCIKHTMWRCWLSSYNFSFIFWKLHPKLWRKSGMSFWDKKRKNSNWKFWNMLHTKCYLRHIILSQIDLIYIWKNLNLFKFGYLSYYEWGRNNQIKFD